MSGARSASAGRFGGGCLMAVFGLPFLAAGLFVLGHFGQIYMDCRRAASWERVPVRIESAELESHRGSKGGMSYLVKANYSFERDGGRCTGTRVAADTGASSDVRHLERYELLKAHMERREPFPAWVNPANPGDCMLFREIAPMSWALLPFGLVFAGAGVGVSAAGVWRVQAWLRRRRRLAANPGRPWRADPRWAAGFVFDSHAGRKAGFAWLTALLASAFTGTVAVAIFAAEAPWFARLFAGAFVLGAVFMAGLAVYWTARLAKYGSPRLAMAELPAVPGRALTAIVLCRRHVDVEGAFRLTLRCRKTTGSGKHRHTETLLDSTVEVSGDHDLGRERGGTAIPVEVPIPAGLPPTTEPGENPSVAWTLAVAAATPGVDFAAEFDLPVFGVENADLIERRPPGQGDQSR
ncbi:MAG TPA: DUF3592 domain-containing protein [Planctomycetota bacterium]|nr:DUF3592 domain-containing protein [Planctomycetota bacterium]